MRILMLNNEFPPLGGGTATVNAEVLRHLARYEDLEIDLITSAPGALAMEEQAAPRIKVLRVPVGTRCIHHAGARDLLRYAAAAVRSGRARRPASYDLIFAWATVPAGFAGRLLQLGGGPPLLIRVSGPDIPGFERRYRFFYPFLKPIITYCWRRAALVVVKCGSEAEDVARFEPRARVALVPNGVDLEAFRPAAAGRGCAPLRLLCVGRLVRRKGQDVLIHAVEQLARRGIEVRATLVGDGDERNAYRALAAKLGVAERVVFQGYIPREAMPRCYAEADVFVLPTENEGMSVAVLEAMAAGLPLVVTRGTGLSELTDEGVNALLFGKGDAAALADILARLDGDRGLAARLGAASRRAAGRYSWEAVAAEYYRLFAQLAGR